MSIRKIKLLPSIVLALAAFLLTIACGDRPVKNTEKILTIATEPTFPPFEMIDKQKNELAGFSIDLMKAIAEEAQFKVEFESLPFDGIIPALQSKQVDAAISSITITAERAKTVSFSRPYFKSGLAIAVQKNTENINSIEDLKNQKIAVQIGTTGAKTANSIPGAKISTFDSAPLALLELNNGNVKAVISDAPVTLYAINNGNLQGIKIVGQLVTEEYYGIAFPKNSPQIEDINQALDTLIENDIYSTIYQKWFDETPPLLPEIAPELMKSEVRS